MAQPGGTPKSRKGNSCADSTRPRRPWEDRSHEGEWGKDIRRPRTKVALQRREKSILSRGIKISFGEQQLISLDHPSAHDHFGSTMARPEREERGTDPAGSASQCAHAVGGL